jgi:hypothetical protein
MYYKLLCYETRKLVLGSLQLISTTLTQVSGHDRLESLPLSGEVGVATEDLMEGAEFELLGDFEDNMLESLTSLFEFRVLISTLVIFALSLITCCAGLEFVAGTSVIVSGSEVFETVFLM